MHIQLDWVHGALCQELFKTVNKFAIFTGFLYLKDAPLFKSSVSQRVVQDAVSESQLNIT